MSTVTLTEAVPHAWLSPDAVLHPVEECGHDDFSDSQGLDPDQMYELGWVKVSENCWKGGWNKSPPWPVTQKQFDVIYEWHQLAGKKFDTSRFEVR